MMRECPCSTKTREVLGNPSPPPSRFSSAVGFAPLDPRDFPRASPSGNPSGLGVQNPRPRKISRISLDPRDFPRASPSGNLLGLGKLGGGDGFPNTSLVLVEHGYIPGKFHDGPWYTVQHFYIYTICTAAQKPTNQRRCKILSLIWDANLSRVWAQLIYVCDNILYFLFCKSLKDIIKRESFV